MTQYEEALSVKPKCFTEPMVPVGPGTVECWICQSQQKVNHKGARSVRSLWRCNNPNCPSKSDYIAQIAKDGDTVKIIVRKRGRVYKVHECPLAKLPTLPEALNTSWGIEGLGSNAAAEKGPQVVAEVSQKIQRQQQQPAMRKPAPLRI
jgi:hypothetical protein